MRNLQLLYSLHHKYGEVSPVLMCQHAYEEISFVYDSQVVKSLNHSTGEVKELHFQEGIIALEFVQLNDCLCFATSGGEIVQFNLSDESSEVVGVIADGIETMCWSPDQELVVMVTKSYNVILMFSTFDLLVESSLHEKAEKEFITVGWGKKETQFHGSVGKEGRKKELQMKGELAPVVDESLDKSISCCWRGDGEFFAVNHVGANGRMFKVYNKEGSLQYTSELCAELQVPMAWRPSGLWIAKPEIHPDKHTITLFERNGLKHNELKLPFSADEQPVTNLSWNSDSDIFLIETTRDGGRTHCLYFYTICNYHWYLKHSMEFSDAVVYNWSTNFSEPKQLHLMTAGGDFSTFKFDFTVNSSSESVVAVIDGAKLLLTNFKSQIVPPPMASLEFPLKSPVNLVEFLKNPGGCFDGNSFATMAGNSLKLHRCVFTEKNLTDVEVVGEFEVPAVDKVVWINKKFLVLGGGSKLHAFSIDIGKIVSEFQLSGVVGNIAVINESEFVAHLVDGGLVQLELADDTLKLAKNLEKLPDFCETIAATENHIYALKHIKKKLYMDSKELATEATSFAATLDRQHLLYTTIGELKFVDDHGEVVDTRRVERGSKIVSLVKDKAQVIFQLPRGNLETISPRILSLKIVKKFLQSQRYREAFDLLRKERINLNLLIDLHPAKFLEDLKLFVEQIDNVQWLNLFLTELKDEDVTLTMYKFCANDDTRLAIPNKISFLCAKFLEVFDTKKFLLPAITCHVKTGEIEAAISMMWGSGEDKDEALKYLLYLIDVNSLYNIALGMYDFQLVLFVAKKSQKDPKEFVPFLNELNKLPPPYQKFKIDCHLKRFGKAVADIAEMCDDVEKFEECAEIVKRHNLYEKAMEVFEGNEICYRKICEMFADHLRLKGKLTDASLMYERGGNFQQAMNSARNVLDWRRCLRLAKRCGVDEKKLGSKLCSALKDAGRFREAANLVRRFGEVSELVEILVKGRMYPGALLEADESMVEEIVRPLVQQHLAEAIKTVEDDRNLYLDQKQRLLAVREEKQRKLLNPPEDDDEMFSDTSSMNSQSSRNTARTFRSSKTKRKHERKLMNLKEGNKFEDVALVDSIWKLVQKIISNENQKAVRDLLVAAVELKFDGDAKVLQKSFKELLLLLKNTMDEVWIEEMLSAGKYPESEEEMLQLNADNSMSKISYELIKPEQRFKPKLNVIEFEMEIFRETTKKSQDK